MLRPFTDVDREPFFELHTHADVVAALGPAPTRSESDAMVERFTEELEREGWGLWAAEEAGGAPFVGMVGLHRMSASASLRYGFGQGGLEKIVAITTTVNTRSQAVMMRLGMVRDVDGDFDHLSVPEGSPLRRHVLYRVTASQLRRTVAPWDQ